MAVARLNVPAERAKPRLRDLRATRSRPSACPIGARSGRRRPSGRRGVPGPQPGALRNFGPPAALRRRSLRPLDRCGRGGVSPTRLPVPSRSPSPATRSWPRSPGHRHRGDRRGRPTVVAAEGARAESRRGRTAQRKDRARHVPLRRNRCPDRGSPIPAPPYPALRTREGQPRPSR